MTFFQIRGFARTGALESLEVPARGRCSLCRLYDEAYSPKAIRDDLSAFELMLPRKGLGAIVALSGGKDSLSTLYLAKVVRGWNVAAYLFDNGFIPKEVIAQASALCERIGVELHVDELRGAARRSFAREVAEVTMTSRTPCDACGFAMNAGLDALCERLGVSQVIFGTNFYASWLDRPSAIAFNGKRTYLNLPYALGVTAVQARRNVKKLGGEIIQMKGMSTNCRVPGLVDARIGRKLGHVPELEVLSLEVMVGHLPRAEALRSLGAQ